MRTFEFDLLYLFLAVGLSRPAELPQDESRSAPSARLQRPGSSPGAPARSRFSERTEGGLYGRPPRVLGAQLGDNAESLESLLSPFEQPARVTYSRVLVAYLSYLPLICCQKTRESFRRSVCLDCLGLDFPNR